MEKKKLLPFILTGLVILADQITKAVVVALIPIYTVGANIFGDLLGNEIDKNPLHYIKKHIQLLKKYYPDRFIVKHNIENQIGRDKMRKLFEIYNTEPLNILCTAFLYPAFC